MHTRPSPSPDLRWLHDAWQRMVFSRPLPDDDALRDAQAFVDGVVPRDRDRAAVVWLLCHARMPRRRPPFGCDAWIGIASAEVYTCYDGGGYGQRRLVQLLERWARWLRATGQLDPEATADLLGDLDRARQCFGYERKRAPQPHPFAPLSLDPIVRRHFPDPTERRWAAIALQATLAFLDEVQGRPGRLHALDPEAFALDLRAMLEAETGDPIHPRAPARVLGSAATAYRELAGTDHLPAPVGAALAERLERLALGCR
jgi:hypothetical protein